ncbi:araC family transcriptional regulator [Streptomyces sp. NL15-2K]|nr:araC family transcriptional regulator [Streptomyces sp. NL15-2K]
MTADLFRAHFPQISLDPDVLFIDDGDVLTSAGAASGLDVCLHIIRKDHGSEVANQVARMCIVPPWRDGGQAQYIQHPVPEATASGTATARQWALENLHEPMTLTDLAKHSHMSLRTFARRFTEEVGMSPGRWLIQQRVDRARHLLETTDLPADEIAGQVGFAGSTSLREHYARRNASGTGRAFHGHVSTLLRKAGVDGDQDMLAHALLAFTSWVDLVPAGPTQGTVTEIIPTVRTRAAESHPGSPGIPPVTP